MAALFATLSLSALYWLSKQGLSQDLRQEKCLCLHWIDIEKVRVKEASGVFQNKEALYLQIISAEGRLQYRGPDADSLAQMLRNQSTFCGCHFGKEQGNLWPWHIVSGPLDLENQRQNYWEQRRKNLGWMPWDIGICLLLSAVILGLGWRRKKR